MALGDVTQIIPGTAYAVEILASATATNGLPSGSSGVEMNLLKGLGAAPDAFRIGIKSTAGSGTMTVTLRVWFRFGSTIGWMVGKAIEASSATPQTSVAIAETTADAIAYTAIVDVPSAADRIYLEVVAIAGTSTAVTGYALIG